MPLDRLTYRLATAADADGIARLNHQTFADEIPQHAPSPDGRLRDRFDAENVYVVAVQGGDVVGMVCLRDRRPFSLDAKLPDLDAHLPPERPVCEVRLLAVRPDHRHGVVFRGLLGRLAEVGRERGYRLAVISGTTRQLKLYRHLGFRPFGPIVGTPEALFQPMALTLEAWQQRAPSFRVPAALPDGAVPALPAHFLPGPTLPLEAAAAALAAPAVSHRSRSFLDEIAALRRRLCALTGARDVQVLQGSGTLANDAVAGQLRQLGTPGVVLAAGEFGERLADHAARWGLRTHVARRPWGTPFDRATIDAALDACPQAGWLWAVACETSTGVRTDLDALCAACAARGVRLALDAVSALGNGPLDLRGVAWASASSGKGLGAFPGLALVFHEAPVAPAPLGVPRALDLGLYAAADGVAFTQSSNLVRALAEAVERRDWPAQYARIEADGRALRHRLRGAGLDVVAPEPHAAPAIATVALPPNVSSERVGDLVEEAGFQIASHSAYLIERNWVQVALMGAYVSERLGPLVRALVEAAHAAGPRQGAARNGGFQGRRRESDPVRATLALAGMPVDVAAPVLPATP